MQKSEWQAGETVSGVVVYTNSGTHPAAYVADLLPAVNLVDPSGQRPAWHDHDLGPLCGGCFVYMEETLGPGKSLSLPFRIATCPSPDGGYLVQEGTYNLVVHPTTQMESTQISGSIQPVRFLSSSVCPKKAKPSTHVVASGDTLFSLARRYQTSVGSIVRQNQLRNPDRLKVGQILLLPMGADPKVRSDTGDGQP